MTEPISRLRVPGESELPESVQKFFAQSRADQGFVLNYFRALSLNPGDLERSNTYLLPFLDPNQGLLPYPERELLATVVSAENRCTYCHIHHVGRLAEALGDRARAERIAIDPHHVDLSPRERALADLAIKITRDARTVTRDDLDTLREQGLSDEEILEAVEIAALFNYTNRISITLGIVPDDEFFT